MKKKHNRIKLGYPLLILVATIFIGIGYASVNGVDLAISGTTESMLPEEVLISDVLYVSNVEADVTNSRINNFTGTLFDSQVVLGSSSDSTITYQVSIYNNTDKDHMFIGVITDKMDTSYYSNPNISFSYTKLEDYVTTISPGATLSFEITFGYVGDDVSNNTLMSKLNFRFMEIPKLVLSNEGENYTIDDMYPGYTKEYEFTVSNYDDTKINNVPMTYYFESTIDTPFTIEIYDENDNKVSDGISIGGDSETKVEHNYTLKVIWDNSNFGDTVDYSDYKNMEFEGIVVLKASPNDSDKYLEYIIEKQFDMNIVASPFNFNVEADSNIKMEKDGTNLSINVSNYSSDSEYNNFDVDYEIIIEGNDKFTYTINGEEPVDGIFTRTLSGGKEIDDNFDIDFMADINNLDLEESLTLKIVSKTPYFKEIVLPITISLQEVKVTLNANGGSVIPSSISVYKGLTYADLPTPTWLGHTFNGWYTASSGGTKITTSTEVTTSSSTQTLYAHWTSYLLADVVKVGDYVSYPVYYSNVATSSDGYYIPKDTYVGWRVLSIDESGDDKYVRLVTAGVPMTYKHPASTTSGATSVANLTTGFFSTAFATTSTNYKFYRSGFKKTSTSTTYVTTISGVQDLFENTYTQTSSSGVPLVQSMTKDDLDAVWGSTTENGEYLTSNDLLAIPAKDKTSYYAAYYVATSKYFSDDGYYYLWNVRYAGGIIFTSNDHGIRPVVKLKTNVIKTGGSGTSASPYTISVE